MKNLNSRISRSCHWISLILFIQSCASHVFAIAYCPSGCLCSLVHDVNLDVKCENIGLTNISYNIPRNASYLALKKNSIERICNNSWQGFDRLLFLDFSENLISSINKTTFSNLSSTLRYLYIDNNKIYSIAAGAFHTLTKLIALTLNFNRLKEIKQGMFDRLPVLNHLSLSNNQLGLRAVKNVTKHDLRYLRKLYLHINVIEMITEDLFFGMERLDDLDLGFNKISHIDENGFRGLGRVAWLRLRDNPFKKLVFTGMTSLIYIDASQTPYLTIDASTFINTSQLTEINFIQSGFTDIPNNTFLPLGNVRYVHLSGIKMSEFKPGTFRGLKKCMKLDIRHMYLTRITNETFSYLEERLIVLYAFSF
ncbi:insulin-like growth factor-binding protein complex acid labile subunit [Actinia tenebrosa]|uniref:Insulin-like growth factor-binding protein complex acid labile subunit n=1 Tax=Actinia tenebrosa TaxID=6105 RepID=A0A6P8HDW1_ACTTE|nr:insulin-like growth factor-binding protein complex acid labile subunit [Actinia tenebrosa]